MICMKIYEKFYPPIKIWCHGHIQDVRMTLFCRIGTCWSYLFASLQRIGSKICIWLKFSLKFNCIIDPAHSTSNMVTPFLEKLRCKKGRTQELSWKETWNKQWARKLVPTGSWNGNYVSWSCWMEDGTHWARELDDRTGG